MSRDYAIRQLFLEASPDPATVRSALKTYSGRLDVPFMVLLSPDGGKIGDTGGPLPEAALTPFRELVRSATRADRDREQAFVHLAPSGSEGKLYTLLVVPIYAPAPEIVAWIGLALPIDHRFASELKEDARLEVTFFYGAEGPMRPVVDALLGGLTPASPPLFVAQRGRPHGQGRGQHLRHGLICP